MIDPVAALEDRIACRRRSSAATVFEFDATALLDDWAAFRDVLDAEERARADRFAIDAVRHRFVLAHAALRLILARRLGGDWRDIRYGKTGNGKPCLATPPASGPVEFNMSHSGDRVLVALSDRPVGVDLEALRPIDRIRDLAERVCTERELMALDGVPPEDATSSLLRLWTCKEAVVKATGLGLSVDPRRVALPDAILEGRPTAELRFHGTTWRLHDLGSPGYAAALVHAA